jgi:cellulose synthase/poly-beta-1,6-N-acetylglucosamine synthase-like glycosyltransferase
MAADLVVPNPDYVVTLDADSMLLPGYCLRLVHLLEQNEHRDMAIAQTPYSASPARPPGWSGSRAPPPTSSTSSTRA